MLSESSRNGTDISAALRIVKAEGALNFSAVLWDSKAALVGFEALRLTFETGADAPQDKLGQSPKLRERDCVVFHTPSSKQDLSVEGKR
jgi:hypothetical protein